MKTQSEIIIEFEREKAVLIKAYNVQVAEIKRLCGDGEACAEGRDRAWRKAWKEYTTAFYELAASYGLFEAKP